VEKGEGLQEKPALKVNGGTKGKENANAVFDGNSSGARKSYWMRKCLLGPFL
jgi:hypothetical protein